MGNIEEMVRGLVDEACGKIMTRIGNKGREIEGEFNSLHKALDTLKHYKVVSVDKAPLYPLDCYDGTNLHEDEDYFRFSTSHDIMVGDKIRVYDDTYHMGMAVVVGRVYAWNDNVVILQCRNCNKREDYIFTNEFEELCKKYIREDDVEKIRTGNDKLKNELCRDIYDLCARHRTTVDHWNVFNRIKEIVFPLLGLEYHRPERWEFE